MLLHISLSFYLELEKEDFKTQNDKTIEKKVHDFNNNEMCGEH